VSVTWLRASEALFETALDAGLVPDTVVAEALRRRVDAEGRVMVDVPSHADVRRKLVAAGFEKVPASEKTVAEETETTVSCWAEALPTRRLERGAAEEQRVDRALLLSDASKGFLETAAQLLRLGTRAHEVAFFEGDEGQQAVSRVSGAPYYALLSAQGTGRVFVAAGPARVWVEFGHTHPRLARLRAPQGQLLLIPAEGPWRRLPDGPWRDLWAAVDVLPAPETEHTAIEPPRKLQVQLRLSRAGQTPPASFWVLRRKAIDQVQRLIQQLPSRDVERLRFAASGPPNDPVVILRMRRAERHALPLEIDGVGFAPFAGLAQVMVPVGFTLHPQVNAVRLRKLFDVDDHEVVWAEPDADNGRTFDVHRIAEHAFEPLTEWVEYLIGAHHEALRPWKESMAFAFEPFVAVRAQRRAAPAATPQPARAASNPAAAPPPAVPATSPTTPTRRRAPRPAPITLDVETIPPSELEEKALAAEEALRERSDLLTAAAAQDWAQLGQLEAALGRVGEASLCFAHALWQSEAEDRTALAAAWSEALGVHGRPPSGWSDAPRTRDSAVAMASELVRRETRDDHAPESPEDQRTWSERLRDLSGLRSRWLVAVALAAPTGDELRLTRERDAIMGALRSGLPLAANVPAFIRRHGSSSGNVDRSVGRVADYLWALWERYQQLERKRAMLEAPAELTDAYVGLGFSWGLARLGIADRSEALRDQSLAALPEADKVHALAAALFRERIDQALLGSVSGLSATFMDAREALGTFERYKFNRLQDESLMLQPATDIDPFEDFSAAIAEGESVMAELVGLPGDELSRRLVRLVEETPGIEPARLRTIIDRAGSLATRYAAPVLERVLQAAAKLDQNQQLPLLVDIARLADTLELRDLVHQSVTLLQAVALGLSSVDAPAVAAGLASVAPAARRAGIETRLIQTVSALEASVAAADLEPSVRAVSRLRLATARRATGQVGDELKRAIDHALGHLKPDSIAREIKLVRAIALALGLTDPATAIAGVDQLLPLAANVTDSFNTNSHFCLTVIQYMEALVLALTGDELCLDPWARRFVEDSEHALRQRMHRDLADFQRREP